ncbi:MAG: class I SAM-dependent methyltransferase [bacterium]|nr:class I SAM-dependent methyltransferase [bacterium]
MAEYDRFAWLYDIEYRNIVDDIPFYIESFKGVDSPLLELGCGTGRILFPLASNYHRVVGLDISSEMLKIARRKLRKDYPDLKGLVKLIKGDMRDFSLKIIFGGVLIAFNTFMHLISIEEQDSCLSCIYRHLEPGGKLIISITNITPELISSRDFYCHNSLFSIEEIGGYLQKYETRLFDTVHQLIKLNVFYDIVDKKGIVTRYVREMLLRYFHRYEMERLFISNGFKVSALYGDYDFSSFKENSPYTIWMLEKR